MDKTTRRRIIDVLTTEEATAKDLSRILHVSEKEIYDHLTHIQKSMKGAGKKLTFEPLECLGCGYVFKNRTKLKPPGKCPQCKKSRIHPPVYRIASGKDGA